MNDLMGILDASTLSVPAVLHMICGKIGAGKSTIAKPLAAEPKTALISEDEWLARLYQNEIHAIADYVRSAGRLREAMAGHITALLAAGTSVVLDFPSNTTTRSWARDAHLKSAAGGGRRPEPAVRGAGTMRLEADIHELPKTTPQIGKRTQARRVAYPA